MQIFRDHIYENGLKSIAWVSAIISLLCLIPHGSSAMDLEEKLPAIAPPSASFTNNSTSSSSDILPRTKTIKKEDGGVLVTPILPPEELEKLSPTAIYNKGALAYQQKDFETALKYWVKASEAGVLGATWRIAHMNRRGIGTAVDHAKAFKYFQQVAEKHKYDARRNSYSPLTIDALVWVGIYYRRGLAEQKVKPAPEKALKIFRYAASHGQHPIAQFHLGDMYVSGNGVKKNGPRGMRWLNLSAQKNYAPSQAALGELFWQGEAVALNKSRAMMFFFLAIQTGQPSDKDKFRERLSMLKATATEPEIEKAQVMLNKWIENYQRKKKN